MPPAAAPIMKHMPTFQASDGIAPQIDGADEHHRRQQDRGLAAVDVGETPQTTEPTTVPISAEKGNSDAVALSTPIFARSCPAW